MLTKQEKADWLEALRSGEYKQCRGGLHDGEGFCCLGVLYDVTHDGDWENPWDERLSEFSPAWYTDGGSVGYYGYGMMPVKLVNALCSQNDAGRSFDQIADWIEANVEAAR